MKKKFYRMQSNQRIMRLTNLFFFFSLIGFQLIAQDQLANRIKIDGVSAVIGDYVILDSDIDKTIVEMQSQGIDTRGVSRCQLLGKLMEDKLYMPTTLCKIVWKSISKKFTPQ